MTLVVTWSGCMNPCSVGEREREREGGSVSQLVELVKVVNFNENGYKVVGNMHTYYHFLILHFLQTWIFSYCCVLCHVRGKQVSPLRVWWAERGWTVRGRKGRTREWGTGSLTATQRGSWRNMES